MPPRSVSVLLVGTTTKAPQLRLSPKVQNALAELPLRMCVCWWLDPKRVLQLYLHKGSCTRASSGHGSFLAAGRVSALPVGSILMAAVGC